MQNYKFTDIYIKTLKASLMYIFIALYLFLLGLFCSHKLFWFMSLYGMRIGGVSSLIAAGYTGVKNKATVVDLIFMILFNPFLYITIILLIIGLFLDASS